MIPAQTQEGIYAVPRFKAHFLDAALLCYLVINGLNPFPPSQPLKKKILQSLVIDGYLRPPNSTLYLPIPPFLLCIQTSIPFLYHEGEGSSSMNGLNVYL